MLKHPNVEEIGFQHRSAMRLSYHRRQNLCFDQSTRTLKVGDDAKCLCVPLPVHVQQLPSQLTLFTAIVLRAWFGMAAISEVFHCV